MATGDRLEGIDVSHHQLTTPSLAGLDFLFARATYGTVVDTMFPAHIARARAAGLVVGAYHFGRHGDVADQVARFLEVAGAVDLYVLDLEADGRSTSMSQAEAIEFLEAVQSTGRVIGLYHSTSAYPDLGQDWRWVADYRPLDEPPIPWDVWQYTSNPIDRDRFRGTRDELVNLGGIPMGLHLTLPPVLATGVLTITAGTIAIRVADGVHYTVAEDARRPAVVANLTGAQSAPGYVVDLHGDELHFIRASSPTVIFTPNAPQAVDRNAVLDEATHAVAALKRQ